MQEKVIINTQQFIWLLFVIITSFTVLQVPGMLIFHAGRDAWLSVIGAWFLDVLLALVYAYMGIRFPGQNSVQYSMTILGKYIGKIVGIMFPLFFLLVCAILLRVLSGLIVNVFLPKAPIEVILVFGYIIVGYAVRKGIETIARACQILGPIYLLSLVIVFMIVIPSVDIEQLKPQFERGIYPFLTGSPFLLTYFGICIITGMYIPLCNRPENGFLAKFISISIGTLMTGILVSFSVGVFGVEEAGKMINPGLQLARLVQIGSFFSRMEIIWMLIGIGAGIMTSSNLIWAFSLGISQIAGLSTYKPLVYPAVLLSFILSLNLFDSHIAVLDFTFYTYPFIAVLVEAGLEIFLFAAALILNKRGKGT